MVSKITFINHSVMICGFLHPGQKEKEPPPVIPKPGAALSLAKYSSSHQVN
jgi:hypothetical protein